QLVSPTGSLRNSQRRLPLKAAGAGWERGETAVLRRYFITGLLAAAFRQFDRDMRRGRDHPRASVRIGAAAAQRLKKQKEFFGQHGVSPSWTVSPALFSGGEKLAHFSETGLAIFTIDQGQ